MVRERSGNRHPTAVPSDQYLTRDERWITLFAAADHLFQRLAQVIGRPELADDERYATATARRENADAVEAIVAAWIAERDADDVLGQLDAAQVAAGPVNSIADVFADPHIQARGNLAAVADGQGGTIRMAGVLPKFSDTPGQIRHAGRPLGADNLEVYGEWLGYSPEQVDAMSKRGVI